MEKETAASQLQVFGNAAARQKRAAEPAQLLEGFRPFVVGIVDQSEILIAQKIFQFARGEGSGNASLQSGWLHESAQNIKKTRCVNR